MSYAGSNKVTPQIKQITPYKAPAPISGAISKVINPTAKVQGSYSGGQAMPAQGTADYNKALAMNQPSGNQQQSNQQNNQQNTSSNSTTGYPGYWQQVIGAQTAYGTGAGNPTANTASQFQQNQANAPTPAAPAINRLQDISQNQTPAVTQAQQEYGNFAKQSPLLLSDVRNNPNVAAEVSVGRGQALGQTLSAEQQALAQNVQNALAGQEQQITAANEAGGLGLTGQQQQIGAANNAGNLALTGQGQQLGALSNVANATAPTQVPYGVQYGTPEQIMAGQTANAGGALNPLNNVQSLAQQVINGQISPSQAYAMGGSIQNWQGVLNQAIQQLKPGFNTANAQGQYEANQANTTTSGTTPTNAASAVYQQTYGQLLDLQNTTQNVDQFGSLLLNSMVAPDGSKINPTNTKFANKTLAEIRGQLSNQQQAIFDNTYASLKSRVSGLLAMGGSEIPTQITADANKILDGSLPLSSLSAVLSRISTEGNILQNNLKSKLNTAGSVIGAPKQSTNNNPAGI